MQEFTKAYYFITGFVLELTRRGESPLWVLCLAILTLILLEIENKKDRERKKRKEK